MPRPSVAQKNDVAKAESLEMSTKMSEDRLSLAGRVQTESARSFGRPTEQTQASVSRPPPIKDAPTEGASPDEESETPSDPRMRLDPELDELDSYHPIVYASNCFDDGVSIIDYVLAYKPFNEQADNEFDEEQLRAFKLAVDPIQKNVVYRRNFVSELTMAGLMIEYTTPESSWDPEVLFIKIHVPWDKLIQLAEIQHLKMPMFRRPRCPPSNIVRKCNRKHWYNNDLFPRRGFFVEFPFSAENAHKFAGFNDKTTFFRPDQRITLCYSILAICPYDDDEECNLLGVDTMVESRILLAAYPLHDGDWAEYTGGMCATQRIKIYREVADVENSGGKSESTMKSEKDSFYDNKPKANKNKNNDKTGLRYSKEFCQGSLRTRLYEGWGTLSNICVIQPKDYVRDYFGEETALYFQWVGFWIEITIPMAFLGFISLILMGYFAADELTGGDQLICSRTDIVMCPLCDKICRFWVPKEMGCVMFILNNYVDNPVPVVMSGILCIWAYCVKGMWERRQRKVLYEWNIHNQVYVEDIIRAEYRTRAKVWEPNYVTGRLEPFYSKRQRITRFVISYVVLLLHTMVTFSFAICIIIFRVEFLRVLWEKPSAALHKVARMCVTICAALMNVCVGVVMSNINFINARRMTLKEYNRTDQEFINSIGLKILLFEMVNIYTPLSYIAFLKGKYFTSFWHHRPFMFAKKNDPGQEGETVVHGVGPLDFCNPAGCLTDLALTTIIYVCCTQFIAVFLRFFVPRLRASFFKSLNKTKKKSKLKKEGKDVKEANSKDHSLQKQWEKDYLLKDRDVFVDFMGSVHSFGFTVLFSSSFPATGLFSLFAHAFRLRMAAKSCLVDHRRPRPIKTQGAGFWINVVHAIAIVCVFTNCFAIAISSQFADKMVWRNKFYNDGPNSTLQERHFHFFRLTRYAIRDMSQEYWPDKKPLKWEKEHSTYFRIYHDTNNSVCYHSDYTVDPYLDTNEARIRLDLFSKKAILEENCEGGNVSCPPRPRLSNYRYTNSQDYWEVYYMKTFFAVFFVLAVYLISLTIDAIIYYKRDNIYLSIQKEDYDEQELIHKMHANQDKNTSRNVSKNVANHYGVAAFLMLQPPKKSPPLNRIEKMEQRGPDDNKNNAKVNGEDPVDAITVKFADTMTTIQQFDVDDSMSSTDV